MKSLSIGVVFLSTLTFACASDEGQEPEAESRRTLDQCGPRAHGLELTLGFSDEEDPFDLPEFSISDDGKLVAVTTRSRLVPEDTDNLYDLYLWDTSRDSRKLVTRKEGERNLAANIGSPQFSQNGRHLVFVADAEAVGLTNSAGSTDVIRYDIESDAYDLVSVAEDGTPGSWDAWSPTISREGRYVSFMSDSSSFVPGATDFVTRLFIKDMSTGKLTLIENEPDLPPLHLFGSATSAISEDGSRVVVFTESTSKDEPGSFWFYDRREESREELRAPMSEAVWNLEFTLNSDGSRFAFLQNEGQSIHYFDGTTVSVVAPNYGRENLVGAEDLDLSPEGNELLSRPKIANLTLNPCLDRLFVMNPTSGEGVFVPGTYDGASPSVAWAGRRLVFEGRSSRSEGRSLFVLPLPD